MTSRIQSLVAIALLLVAAGTRGDQETKVEKKKIRAADGIDIACEVRGQGETAIVFLHGWCGDHEYWKNQVDVFAPSDKVVAIDQAGHGESGKDRKNWTVDSLAGDVESVVKNLGLKRVVLVGHSMGGPVSLAAAKRMPGIVVAVVGVDTLHNAEFKMSEDGLKQVLDMFEKDFKGTMNGMFPSMLNDKIDPKVGKWLIARAENQDKTMALGLMRDMSALDTKVMMKEAKVPIRCINSAGGFKFFRPTETATNKKYADFNVVLMEDVGHYPMLEKPDEFNSKLKDVLIEFNEKR